MRKPIPAGLATCLLFVIALFLGINQTLSQNEVPTREAVIVPSTARQGNDGPMPMPLAPPANDNCSSATTLTVGAACLAGTTLDATTQGGEYLCINPGGGISPETVWYRFTATSTSMVLGVVLTNTTNCATVLAVYGPFAPGGGCLPGAGNQLMCQNMGLIDPGFHPNLTSLVVGMQYLVQVQGNNCGGGNDRFANFCISVQPPAANVSASTASTINNCGSAFTGTTSGGHFANGTSIGSNNLDNNAGTTVIGGSEAGDDVTFVINNVSWFSFCNGNALSCNWSINVNNITNCLLSTPNNGVQAAVFTGNPTALTNVASSPSRIAPGGSWSSGSFAVGASQCAYIAVDGFAGDECSYDLTLTNVSCPCAVLPAELSFFSGKNLPNQIDLEWEMVANHGISHFMIERSSDGIQFETMIPRHEASTELSHRYLANDSKPLAGWNHYRLTAIDMDGNASQMSTVAVYRKQGANLQVWSNPGQDAPILLANSPEDGLAQVIVTDLQGRMVLSQGWQLSTGLNRMELPSLSHGSYLAQVTLNGATVVQKVMH